MWNSIRSDDVEIDINRCTGVPPVITTGMAVPRNPLRYLSGSVEEFPGTDDPCGRPGGRNGRPYVDPRCQQQEAQADAGLREVRTRCYGKAFRSPSDWFATQIR